MPSLSCFFSHSGVWRLLSEAVFSNTVGVKLNYVAAEEVAEIGRLVSGAAVLWSSHQPAGVFVLCHLVHGERTRFLTRLLMQ